MSDLAECYLLDSPPPLLPAPRPHCVQIEDKLDGERALMHKVKDDIMIFSRNQRRQENYTQVLAPYLLGSVRAWVCLCLAPAPPTHCAACSTTNNAP